MNGRHELGWAPLHVAAVNCRREVVSVLLAAGAQPDLEEEFMNVYTTAREKRRHSLEVQISREDEFSNRLSNRANFRSVHTRWADTLMLESRNPAKSNICRQF